MKYSASRDNEHWIGYGILDAAMVDIAKRGLRNPFVVASDRAWRQYLTHLDVERKRRWMIEAFRFHGFSPNPSLEEIRSGISLYNRSGCGLVLAIGGGSAIDTAKMIRALASAKESDGIALPEAMSSLGPPLAAIPTTAGSGSEATPFAVYYIGDVKHSLDHASLRPDIAIVDAALSADMPPDITASTGFDALSQAIESFWAPTATPDSRDMAEDALGLLLSNIENAVTWPDKNSRIAMARGAYHAGRAIAVTRTTAAHALSYRLTKRYGIPHGHAVALNMACCFDLNSRPVAESNYPGGESERLAVMRRLFAILGVDTARQATVFWVALMRRCGLSSTLYEAGIRSSEAIRDLVEHVDAKRLANNPVRLRQEQLYRAMLAESGMTHA